MFDLLTNRVTLKGLYALALAKAFFRYNNPRRQQTGRDLTGFHHRIWKEAADALGASYTRLTEHIGEISLDGVSTRVYENTCGIDDPVTMAVLSDKPLTHRILNEAGVPTPRHATFSLRNMAPAVAFLKDQTGRDCVVKPAGGTGGGRGVTTGVRTRSHLARAAAAAAVYADELMIEQQVEGENYRLLYLDGELIDAFARRLPSVVGDGRSTVAALVKRANEQRLAGRAGVSQVLLTVDLDMRRTLARQGLTMRSVPAEGRVVNLKTVVNENAGADNTTATHLLCKGLVEEGSRACRVLRTRLAGIDLITPDPNLPLAESGGVIIEVNAHPNLYFHYQKRDGAFEAAKHILPRLLGRERGRMAEHPPRGATGRDEGRELLVGATAGR